MTRTNTDRIDDLAKTAVETASRVDNLDQRVEKEVNSIRENLAEQKTSTADAIARANERLQLLEMKFGVLSERDAVREKEMARLREELAEEEKARVALQIENAVLKQQLQDHVAQYQEWDKRRWGLIVLLLGAVLSLASGLIVTLAKK